MSTTRRRRQVAALGAVVARGCLPRRACALGQRFGVPAIEYKQNKLRLQLLPTTRMKHDALVEWLSEPNSPLRFQPETTLEMLQVPQSMDGILAGLQQFQRIFSDAETHV